MATDDAEDTAGPEVLVPLKICENVRGGGIGTETYQLHKTRTGLSS